MRTILFMRRFKKAPERRIRTSGGHIKIRDYFMHCLHHPDLEPYLYFTPDSVYEPSDVWDPIPRDRIVREARIHSYDLLFTTGRDWKLLQKNLGGKTVVNYLQSLDQCETTHKVFRYLQRPAVRICVSKEIQSAIAPYISGVSVVINNGIPLELFRSAPHKKENAILICAIKQPELGRRLYDTLRDRDLEVELLSEYLPRQRFAERLAASDIVVTLPLQKEGCYLPAVEGMASGCAVVCTDVVGTYHASVHGQTCLMPKYGEFHAHLAMIDRLLADAELKERIRQGGREIAQTFSLERERMDFYRFLETYIRT